MAKRTEQCKTGSAGLLTCISLTRSEVLELVVLLTAQAVGETAPGLQAGAVPEIRIMDRGVTVERILCYVEDGK
jgi:hypothetical protein